MKIKELIYNTPEMTEEKLLSIIDENLNMMNNSAKNRICQLHKGVNIAQAFLDEYDLIQDKKSYLTKSQRDQIVGFVGMCMIKMTKDDGGGSKKSTSNSGLESIPEAEEVRDNS